MSKNSFWKVRIIAIDENKGHRPKSANEYSIKNYSWMGSALLGGRAVLSEVIRKAAEKGK
jgi:hypothetical protein